jgi:hypothetical protein
VTYDILPQKLIEHFVFSLVEAKLLWDLLKIPATLARKGISKLRRQKRIENSTVSACLDLVLKKKNISIPANHIKGELAPYVQLRNTYLESFVDIAAEISKSIAQNPLNTEISELFQLDRIQWNRYGPSIQSSLPGGTQVVQLTEVEEVTSIPVILSDKRWRQIIRDFPVKDTPHTVLLSGAILSTEAESLSRLVGMEIVKKLKLAGHVKVLIPDSELVEYLGIDIDVAPSIDFISRSTVYMAYLWAIYSDSKTGEYWPIYEYGSIANPPSYSILAEMLLSRIAFYKNKVWNDIDVPPQDRRFRLQMAVNDDLYQRICGRFNEPPQTQVRHDLIEYIRGGSN